MTALLKAASFVEGLYRHRTLISRLTHREIAGRYRGSFLGWGWSVVNPLIMLCVYTFVFSTVFKAQWANTEQKGPLSFAINLFTGLIVFNLFSECANKAPTLVVRQPNYVTKIVFPLEVLSAVTVAAAGFHAVTSLLVLAVFKVMEAGGIGIAALWLPIVWIPLGLGCLSLCWILSALGVFIRDLPQLVSVGVSMLMFLSAVFYPVSALPSNLQPLLQINPLVIVIEQTRLILVEGKNPDPAYLALGIPASIVLSEICYRVFKRVRVAFSDVI